MRARQLSLRKPVAKMRKWRKTLKHLGFVIASLATLAQPALAAPAMTYDQAYTDAQKATTCAALAWQVLASPDGDSSWVNKRDRLDDYAASLEPQAFPSPKDDDGYSGFVKSQGPGFQLGRMMGMALQYEGTRLRSAIGETPGMSQDDTLNAIAKIAMTQYDADGCDSLGK